MDNNIALETKRGAPKESSRSKSQSDITLEIQKFSEKIFDLVQKRKYYINQIKNSLKIGDDSCLFLKTINLLDHAQLIEGNNSKSDTIKSYFFLGTLLSSTLDLPNSLEKLFVMAKFITEHIDFTEKASSTSEKHLISQMSNISLSPPSMKLKLEILDGNIQNLKFMDNVTTLFDKGGVSALFSKKIVRINGVKYSLFEKKIVTETLQNWHKSVQLPAKMSYQMIVCSTAEILSLIYTMFLDEIFYNAEAYEWIEKIDDMLVQSFVRCVFKDLFNLSLKSTEIELDIFQDTLNETQQIQKGPPSFETFID